MENRSEANTLKELREKRGHSLSDVAVKLGVDRSYVSYLEHGKRRMTLELAGKLAEVYGVDVNKIADLCKEAS